MGFMGTHFQKCCHNNRTTHSVSHPPKALNNLKCRKLDGHGNK